MSDINLPPLPSRGATGPGACEQVRVYLAVWDDLTPQQVQLVTEHVRFCEHCSSELRLMQRATWLVGRMEASKPSARVDQAVLAAIAARGAAARRAPTPLRARSAYAPKKARSISRRLTGAIAGIAAAVVVALLAVYFSLFGQSAQSPLPQSLSWSGYVLYHTETLVNAKGESYHVSTYHDLSNGHIHVETVMNGSLDVIAVGDTQQTLGMDAMHHVAQWDAQAWTDDETNFDLTRLRQDLQAGRASYLGEQQYAGQNVYRIRLASNNILLLDMQYMPVNVLQQSGAPVYDKVQMLSPMQVADSMWTMSVPQGYQMGTLPPKP